MQHPVFRSIGISLAFIIIIAFPLLNNTFKWVSDIKNEENRKLASEPAFDIAHLDAYPVAFEKYYNDYFTFRSLFVKYYSSINLSLFNISPIPNEVLIGNDGWLFLAGNEIDSYTGLNNFRQTELDSFKVELEYRKNYLMKRGCKYYFLIAPVKANIYTDKLPKTKYKFQKNGWGEQLIEYLNNTSTAKPINIYSLLRQQKDNEALYYQLDNHWTQLGAFYAANEVFESMHADFPSITKNNLSDYYIKKSEIKNGNIIQMLSNVGDYTDTHFELNPKSGFTAKNVAPYGYPVIKGFAYPWDYEVDKEKADTRLPKIVIISDSYGTAIFPFIAEKFRRSVKIFDAWQYKLNEDIIENEKPDIVLTIVLEANLRNMLLYSSGLGKK